MANKPAALCKCILLGQTQAGKNALWTRLGTDTFPNYHCNVRCEFHVLRGTCTGRREADSEIKVQLWWTCRMERFRAIPRMYVRCASVALMAYDTTSKESLGYLMSEMATEPVFVIGVGLKADLLEKREVDLDEARTMISSFIRRDFEQKTATFAVLHETDGVDRSRAPRGMSPLFQAPGDVFVIEVSSMDRTNIDRLHEMIFDAAHAARRLREHTAPLKGYDELAHIYANIKPANTHPTTTDNDEPVLCTIS